MPTGSGRILAGRYRLAKALGGGGMGTVWLALDLLLNREVAVKEVSPPADVSAAEGEMLRERTMHEARTAARLNHPNIVTIYDVVEDSGRPWLVMELVPARSLRDIVLEDGPLRPRQAARVGLQLLGALRAAHELGILHRDVKPGNVLMNHDGRAMLTDFGIARSQDSPALTTTGVLLGTPAYIAPERARGEPGGPQSDLWSLGATLYAVVEGRPPFDRGGALATLTAVVTEDADEPRRSGPLRPVISGLLRKDQAGRLGPAEAERMLRRIAEADERGGTVPRSAGDFGTGVSRVRRPGPGSRLRQAERTRGFRPAAAESAAAAPHQPGLLAPSTAVDEDAMLTPPAGLPVFVTGPPDRADPEPITASASSPHPVPEAERSIVPGNPRPARSAPGGQDAADAPAALRDAPAPHRRRLVAWAAAAAAALVLAAGVLFGVNVLGRSSPSRPAAAPPPRSKHPAPAGPTTPPAVSPPPSRPPSPGHSATPPSGSRPRGASRPVVPADFRRYHDPTGFSIAVPDGWQVSHQGHYVYVTPPSGAAFLLIDQSGHPKPNPLADWRQQEANRIGTYPGYHRIRLEAITYAPAEKAADWEFTYDRNGVPTHVLNRNILANSRHAYALYWSTPESEWAQSFHLFQVFARTFQPAQP